MRVILGKVAKVMMVLVLGVSGVLFGGVSDVDASKKRTPTVFLHGFHGNSESMVDAISYTSGVKKQSDYNLVVVVGSGKSKKEHKLKIVPSGQRMVYIVDSTGKVRSHQVVYKSGTKGIRDDLIQVVFMDANEPISVQDRWLNSVLNVMYSKYKTYDFNLVGHSMGGLLGANYMIQDSTKGRKFNLKKLITVGSPLTGHRNFDLVKKLPTKPGQLIRISHDAASTPKTTLGDLKTGGEVGKYIRNGKKLKTDTLVASIAFKYSGTGDDGDGIVGSDSALALKKVMNPGKNYIEYTAKFGNHLNYFNDKIVNAVIYRMVNYGGYSGF